MTFRFSEFADATHIEPSGEGLWRAEIQPDWDIAGAANGGYLLSIVARASAAAGGRPDPVTVTGHFLSPGTPGPVTIATEVIKTGRRFATVRSKMTNADGRPLLTSIGAFSDLTDAPGPEMVSAVVPDLPPVDECVPVDPTPAFPPPFMTQVELRIHPEDSRFAMGRPTGTARVRGWFRFRRAQPLDTLGLIVATDAFPPTIFNTELPIAWAPTVELTTHIRKRPDPDAWLRCAFTTRFITRGFLEEDGELWDEDGHFVAQSRQLALLPRD